MYGIFQAIPIIWIKTEIDLTEILDGDTVFNFL